MPAEKTATTTRFPRITEHALDDLRKRIGVKITDTLEPWCHEASRDGIRHYAHGIGDDNPLWCDPAYAARTRWGGIIVCSKVAQLSGQPCRNSTAGCSRVPASTT